MAGLPGATVAAYRDRALEEGWHLFRIDCSRHGRQTETGFFKDLKSFVAYLDVSAVLPNGGYQVEPGLTVGLHTGNRPPPPSRLRPGTLRGDVNCLSRLDAGDPSMHRFTPPATPRDLCATLTLTEAASVVPGVTVAAPADGGCLYKDGLGQQYFGVSNAWEARSLYEATQFSALGMERGVLLQGDWDLSGAWVDLPSGPVMLFASPGFLVEDQLLMLAQFIQS